MVGFLYKKNKGIYILVKQVCYYFLDRIIKSQEVTNIISKTWDIWHMEIGQKSMKHYDIFISVSLPSPAVAVTQ